MRRTAAQEDVDDRLVIFLRAASRLGPVEIGQIQPRCADSQSTDLEKAATRDSVTKSTAAALGTMNRQHRRAPL